MTKGTKNERKAKEALQSAGYWCYSPQRVQYGDNDPWNLFDTLAFQPQLGTFRMVQVKTNSTQGELGSWAHLAKYFREDYCNPEFWIRYDREGWRVIAVKEDGTTTELVDTRPSDGCTIAEGIKQWLQFQVAHRKEVSSNDNDP